jgi:putative DNA primase/helicase
MDIDVVGTFVKECFEIAASLKWRLNNTLLYNTYVKWCSKNNKRLQSQKWLTMRMSEKGFMRMLSNGERLWLGLVLKDGWRV